MFENMVMFGNLHFNVSYHSMVLMVMMVLTMLLLVPCLPAAADGTTSPTDLFNSIKLLVSYFGENKQSQTPDAMLGVRFAKCK